CVNNIDPHLPGCTPNGLSHLEVLPPRLRIHTAQMQQFAADDVAQINTAITHLLDPQNPGAGYVNSAPTTGSQHNFCSQPMAMNLKILSGSSVRNESTVTAITFKTLSKDTTTPRARKNVSKLRLVCKARPLP